MNISCLQFLDSSTVMPGAELLVVLTTPFHRWTGGVAFHAATVVHGEDSSPVTFVDVADQVGL